MKTLIIYDSVFGNTEKVAQVIASALGTTEDVRIAKVTETNATQLAGLEHLIVGSPTRGFRPTEPLTGFLKSIPENALIGIRVAAFDTRIAVRDIKNPILRFMAGIGGYAAKPIAEHLKKKGGTLVVPPEGFYVNASEGPLKDGELERVAAWALQIVRGG